MKNMLLRCSTIFTFILVWGFSSAQDTKPVPTMYSIHADYVKPSMIMEYEKTLKEFSAFLTENKVKDFDYSAFVTEEFKYLFVNPMDKMADLDSNPMAQISDKAQQDKLKEIFSRMDPCYSKHGNYMLFMDSTLTYMPDGFSNTTPGESFRVFFYHHYEPQHGEDIYKAFKAIRDMYGENNAKMHFRAYHSGFGLTENYILVAISAKDASDFDAKNRAVWELLGEDYQNAIIKLMKYTSKYEIERAWHREDLSFKLKE